MSRSSRFTTATTALALISMVACGTSDTAGRQPIGSVSDAASAEPTDASGPKLPLAALNALNAGNTAYRAKQFDVALASYREAAVAAPAHAAPWFGMYMVASEMKNTALADSAMGHVKSLSADPSALGAHAKVTSEMTTGAGGSGHPSAASPNLPAGHPSTQPLPSGHPSTIAPLTPRKSADSVGRSRARSGMTNG
ncbi:MAG: hypothetical protein IPP90_15285 [Gemmatimonadaceae bacterium]|nr:hypothetical protein [Gemmatimonadaceae bacterium]